MNKAFEPKVITNFIIIPAPTWKTIGDSPSPSLTKLSEEALSQQQRDQSRLIEKSKNNHRRQKYPKDDYQKNITINVVKCCIREIVSLKYQKLLSRKCRSLGVSQGSLIEMVAPVLKNVVISLADLKKMLTESEEGFDLRLKRVLAWFLEWYLRKRYMNYLLVQGKMDHKERYVQYKNKYMLYLLELKDLLQLRRTPKDKDLIIEEQQS